jgi:hypothetical protein
LKITVSRRRKAFFTALLELIDGRQEECDRQDGYCKRVGISRKKFYEWHKDDTFRERCWEILEELEGRYCRVLDSMIFEDRNIGALTFKLKSINPRRYDEGVRRAMAQAKLSSSSAADDQNLPQIASIVFVREPAPHE